MTKTAEWLTEIAGERERTAKIDELFKRIEVDAGGTFSREEINAR